MDATTPLNIETSFLQTHIYEIQFAAIFGGMIVLFLLEGFIPRRKTKADQTHRWINNIALAFFSHFFILFYAIFLVSIMVRFQPESPLLQAFNTSDLFSFIVILLVLEFLIYWIHRALHRIPWLWRIHAVHHTDTEFDVTTSHRHHPFEPMLTALISTPIIFALGAPIIVLILYNLTVTAISLISHSNIVLPKKIDQILRLFIITPDFHRMHHSSDKRFTNSNYGVILPWFDYLFRTASKKPYPEIPSMQLGLETLREPKDNRLDKLLITPFIYK